MKGVIDELTNRIIEKRESLGTRFDFDGGSISITLESDQSEDGLMNEVEKL